MGWSCRADAMDTLQAWQNDCHKVTNCQNTYTGKDGEQYLFETSRTEHDDGAITGTSYRYVGEYVRKSGSFRINGDGSVSRWPASWPFAKR